MSFLCYDCACGHVEDEHAKSGFLRECLVAGCGCPDFERQDERDEGEEESA